MVRFACFRCVNRNAKMVCSECPMVSVGVMCDHTVPVGRSAHLQRPQRFAAGFGRTGRRRRGHIRFRPDNTRRPDVPETKVSEDQQTIATGRKNSPTESFSTGVHSKFVITHAKKKKTFVLITVANRYLRMGHIIRRSSLKIVP